MTKDIIIIGAGPGGYETAIRACQLGLNVTLIEKGSQNKMTCDGFILVPGVALVAR